MRPSARALSAALLAIAAPAAAEPLIVSRVLGPDIEITAEDPLAGCSGDLYRSDFLALPFGAGPPAVPTMPGVSCPFVVAGDGAPTGIEGATYYLLLDASGPLPETGMAFRTERHFDVVDGFRNIYMVSLPNLPGVLDVANTAAPEADKCVGDPAGPAAADGLLNADDLLCAWWTSRGTGQGSMMISRRDEATAAWQVRVAFVNPGTGDIVFAGSWTDELDPRHEGYVVTVNGAPGTENRAIVTGGHDASDPGRAITTATDTQFLLNLPHHGMYAQAVEILCGLEGVDWRDATGDGWPDTCDGAIRGVFDGGHAAQVVTYDNVPDGSLTDDAYVALTAAWSPIGGLRFMGTNFPLRPGDAYLLFLSTTHDPTHFLVPHY